MVRQPGVQRRIKSLDAEPGGEPEQKGRQQDGSKRPRSHTGQDKQTEPLPEPLNTGTEAGRGLVELGAHGKSTLAGASQPGIRCSTTMVG